MSKIRSNKLLELLEISGRSTYSELAEQLEVSEETVRRDVKKLAKSNLIELFWGGAALPDVFRESAFRYRLAEQAKEKRAIAKAAARFVENGESVMISGGSTTCYFALELKSRRDLTVITNSVDAARILVAQGGNRVHTVGGEMDQLTGASWGIAAVDNIQRFKVKRSFFSIDCVNEKDALMSNYSVGEVACLHAMIDICELSYLLVDSSKFGKRGVFKCAEFEDIDYLITDADPNPSLKKQLTEASCKLIVGDSNLP